MAVDCGIKSFYVNCTAQNATYEDPRTEDDQSADVLSRISSNRRRCEYEIVQDPKVKSCVKKSIALPKRPAYFSATSDKAPFAVLQPNHSVNPKLLPEMDWTKACSDEDLTTNRREKGLEPNSLLESTGILRVELESRNTKLFQFQQNTTAGDAVTDLCSEFGFRDPNLFSLVLAPANLSSGESLFDVSVAEGRKKLRSTMTLEGSSPVSFLIAPWDCLEKVVSNPKHHRLLCHFRLEIMPRDFYELARNDREAFRYLFMQCVNDVVADVYKHDLSREEMAKLAAMQMQELVLSTIPQPCRKVEKSPSISCEEPIQTKTLRFTRKTLKLSLRRIEKDFGLRRFLPASLTLAMGKSNTTSRSVRKSIQQNLKALHVGSPSNQHPIANSPIVTVSTVLLQLRLRYLKMLSPHHLFGGRYFSATCQSLAEPDIVLLVGHNYGISQLINTKTRMVSLLAKFQHVSALELETICQAGQSGVTAVKIGFPEKADLLLTMEPQTAHNFVLKVAGYCRVYGNVNIVPMLYAKENTSEMPLSYALKKDGNCKPSVLSPSFQLSQRNYKEKAAVTENSDSSDNCSSLHVSCNVTYNVKLTSVAAESSSVGLPPSYSTRSNLPTYNGYLVPTTQSQKTTKVGIDVQATESNSAGTDGKCMHMQQSSGPETRHTGNLDRNDARTKNTKHLGTLEKKKTVPSPPRYPPPKRRESMKRDIYRNAATSLSSFKLGTGEINTFAHESGGESSPNGRIIDVEDEMQSTKLNRKLGETEHLIENVRQQRVKVVDSSADFNAPVIVSDIAVGNKQIREVTSRNRRSWVDNESLPGKLIVADARSISISTPDLSTGWTKKKSKNLFRRLFGDRKRRNGTFRNVNKRLPAPVPQNRDVTTGKFRLRRAFTFITPIKDKSISAPRKENVQKSNRSQPSDDKTNKKWVTLAISGPYDTKQQEDMLVSEKSLVAQTMHSGQTTELKVTTLDSTYPSKNNLALQNEERFVQDEAKSPVSTSVPLKLKTTSTRERMRPESLSTFQQANLKSHFTSTTVLRMVDESERDGNPCELSPTESSEALHEIMKKEAQTGQGLYPSPEATSAQLYPPSRLLQTLIPALGPVVSVALPPKVVSLPAESRSPANVCQATALPIQPSANSIEKRPSHKRPAPQPPATKRPADHVPNVEVASERSHSPKCAIVNVEKSGEEKNDWDNGLLFTSNNAKSPSLMTEIFSLLEQSGVVSTGLPISTMNSE